MSALTPQSDMPTPTTDKITQAAMETIYLCKFRVSMDGEWLCLRELDDISLTPDPEPTHEGTVRLCPGSRGPALFRRCAAGEGASPAPHARVPPAEPGQPWADRKDNLLLHIALRICKPALEGRLVTSCLFSCIRFAYLRKEENRDVCSAGTFNHDLPLNRG